jgi:hypothetical protein
VTTAWSQATPEAPQVRADGVYYICGYSNPGDPANPVCTYVRFFPPIRGLYVLSADKPEQVARWLTQENRAGEGGVYELSGTTLSFVMLLPTGTRTLKGELTGDGWTLGGNTYSFFAAPATGSEKSAPGENRIPIVAGAVDVSNSIGLGPTGRQESMTTTVTIDASDPDGDPLTFTWRASNGELSPAGNRVAWRRPVQLGRAEEGLLVVELSDGKGGKTTRAWVMH